MSKYNVEVVSKEPFDLGEGPHWDGKSQYLYLVDISSGDVCRVDVNTNNTEKVHVQDNVFVSIVVPCEHDQNELIVAKNNQILKYNWQTKTSQLLGQVEKDVVGNRINDGKCDAKGRFWFGTMPIDYEKQENKGSLYCMDGSNKIVQKVKNISLSNGIAWSLDNKKMYYIDSTKKKIYVFDFDLDTGNLSNQRTLVDFNGNPEYSEHELPDGMTIDKTGKLWVACFRGSRVVKIDSDTGALLDEVKLPAERITSVCFGGQNLNKLYVTSAKSRLNEEEKKNQPLAGHLFVVTSDDTSFVGAKPFNDFVENKSI